MPLWNAWTDDEKQAFREVAPGKTGQQIANILTERFGRPITRSAIAGQCRRLRVSLMKDDAEMRKRCEAAKQAKAKARPPIAAWIARQFQEVLAEPKGYTILELNSEGCKYPLWGQERPTVDSMYCGAPVIKEGAVYIGPYCEEHRSVAYSWDPRKSRKTVKEPAKPEKSGTL